MYIGPRNFFPVLADHHLIVFCRHPSGPSAAHLRREAAGGRAHTRRLRRPEGVDAAPGAPPQRQRKGRQLPQERRAQPPPARAQTPPAQDDLPRVRRTNPQSSHLKSSDRSGVAIDH